MRVPQVSEWLFSSQRKSLSLRVLFHLPEDIFVLEARALLAAINFTQQVVANTVCNSAMFYIDNTSVLHSAYASRSRNYMLNHLVKAIHERLDQWVPSTIQYVRSASNLADFYSRLGFAWQHIPQLIWVQLRARKARMLPNNLYRVLLRFGRQFDLCVLVSICLFWATPPPTWLSVCYRCNL